MHKMTAHLIAMSAHMDVFGQRCHEATDAIVSFGRNIRRNLAATLRTLSKDSRRAYWALRQTGMYPYEAIARVRRD